MTPPSPDPGSAKGHRDENFPVASFIIKKRHRQAVMAFYRFARKADDIADDPKESGPAKLAQLESMRRTLAGESDEDRQALELRRAQAERGLSSAHALELLEAFRRDVDKNRYADWGDLMDYCRFSAMPVGRFVLDVHQESRALWPASDALCAALQVINHLQDCGKDYRELNRAYIPGDALAAHGCALAALGQPRSSPGLREVIAGLADQTMELLARSRAFAQGVKDPRLGYEVAAIQRLAESLTEKLKRADPLVGPVRHGRLETVRLLALAAVDRLAGRSHAPRQAPAGWR